MAKDNIVCSFINISSEDGVKILTRLSNLGNDTYYFCRTASGLIDVMLTSVSGEIGNTEIYQSAQIQYRSSDDPVLNNVKTLPDLQGYNYCRIKGGSTTVLTVQYIKKDEKSMLPVSLRFRYTPIGISEKEKSLPSPAILPVIGQKTSAIPLPERHS